MHEAWELGVEEIMDGKFGSVIDISKIILFYPSKNGGRVDPFSQQQRCSTHLVRLAFYSLDAPPTSNIICRAFLPSLHLVYLLRRLTFPTPSTRILIELPTCKTQS